MQDMTSGHPLKLIVKFSIPLLIGNIFQQLYSISDIIIVGRLIGIKALAAVGVSAPLFFMLVLVSIGFTNGLDGHHRPAFRRPRLPRPAPFGHHRHPCSVPPLP